MADQWLTATSLRPVRVAAEELAQRLEVSRRAAEAVRNRAGVPCEVLAAPLEVKALPELPRLDPPAVHLDPLTAGEAKALSGRFAADADELEHQQRNLDRATGRLGLPDVIDGNTLVTDTDPRVATARLDGVDVTSTVDPWDPRPVPRKGSQTLEVSVAIAGAGTLTATIRPRYTRAW